MFIGILLSLLGAGVALWFGGDKVSPGETILIGLVGLALSFQVDILLRLERRDRFVALLDGPPWVSDTVARVASSLGVLNDEYPGTMVESEAQQRLGMFAVELDELAQGRVRTDAEDVRFLISETAKCKEALVAVTNLQPGVSGTAWWHSDIGRNYWKANLEALGRGVRISRIFITDDENDAALDEIVAAQCRAGAEVFVVPRKLVSPKLQRNIAVWDEAVAWEADMNAAGLPIEYVYLHAHHDVERLKKMYELLHLAAHAREVGVMTELAAALPGSQVAAELATDDLDRIRSNTSKRA